MAKQIRISPKPVAETTVRPSAVSINLESGSVLVYYGHHERENFTLVELDEYTGGSFVENVLEMLAERLGGAIENAPEPRVSTPTGGKLFVEPEPETEPAPETQPDPDLGTR